MNDHNLDDLIIDNIDPKNSKTKSFLTILALAIVVLIVAIILTRIVLQEPKNDLALDEAETEMISPELKLQNKEKVDKNSLALENKPKKTVAKPTNPVSEGIKPETIQKTEEKITQAIEEEKKVVAQNVTPMTTQSQADIKQPVSKKVEAEKTETKTPPVKQPSKSVEKPAVAAPKTKTTSKNNVSIPSRIVSGSYYIQVGSYTQIPSKGYLKQIKNSGFDYILTKPNQDGTKKLLIGPYKKRTVADTALVRVRDRINKGAFIVKK